MILAPLYLRTLWRYTNAVIIIIIITWDVTGNAQTTMEKQLERAVFFNIITAAHSTEHIDLMSVDSAYIS